MKRILIALAVAGTLASTAAVAATAFLPERDSAGVVHVQYYGEPQYNRYYGEPQYNRYYGEPQYNRWDDRSMRIDEREARINERIQRGVNDGRLTNWEARRLYRELRAIEAKERAFKSDGRLDRREAAQLNEDLDRLALNVGSELRDEQRRY